MTSATNYKPSENKREEFRKYLEKTGVMDALTKVLVCLYEEPDKPEDALEYLINKLAVQAGYEALDALKAQLEEANAKIAELEGAKGDSGGGEEVPPEGAEEAPAPAEEEPAEAPAEAPTEPPTE